MKYTFNDYNKIRPHSSIDCLPPSEFSKKFLNDQGFSERFDKKEVKVILYEN